MFPFPEPIEHTPFAVNPLVFSGHHLAQEEPAGFAPASSPIVASQERRKNMRNFNASSAGVVPVAVGYPPDVRILCS